MRTTVKLLSWLLVGSAAVSGCGSDKKHGAQQVDPLAEVTGFCAEWGKRACNANVLEACASKLEDCQEKQALFCLSILPPNYARKNADACLAAVSTAYADAKLDAKEYATVIDLAAPCDKLIEGPGEAGAACRETFECNTLEDLICVALPGEPGTCQVPVTQGGGRSCVEAFQVCESDFYCNGSNCVERRAAGQPCSAQDPCMEDSTCAGPEGSAVCTPKKPDREPCTSNDECASKICGLSVTGGRCAPQILLDVADPLCSNLAK
jgi:hypothetical protein